MFSKGGVDNKTSLCVNVSEALNCLLRIRKQVKQSYELVDQLRMSDGKFNKALYSKIVKSKKKYLSDLYEGLNHGDPFIREACVEALGEIGAMESIPILIAHSADPDWNVRWDIKTSINMLLGVFPLDVIASLTGCLRLKQRHVFKKKMERLFDDLFTGKSLRKINKGYSLVVEGKTDKGLDIIRKGCYKGIEPEIIKKKLVELLKARGFIEEAKEIQV